MKKSEKFVSSATNRHSLSHMILHMFLAGERLCTVLTTNGKGNNTTELAQYHLLRHSSCVGHVKAFRIDFLFLHTLNPGIQTVDILHTGGSASASEPSMYECSTRSPF